MKYCFASLKRLGFSLILLSTACVYGESFRVAKLNKVQIPQDYTPQTVKAGIYDGVSITLPEDQTFITGIKLNHKGSRNRCNLERYNSLQLLRKCNSISNSRQH